MQMTHYDVLGVPLDATTDQIRSAYWSQIQFYHPDVFPGDATVADTKARQLNESYAVLSNPALRKEYDESLYAAVPTGEQAEYKDSQTGARYAPQRKKNTFPAISRIFAICFVASVIIAVFYFASQRWRSSIAEEPTLSENVQAEATQNASLLSSDKVNAASAPSSHVPINGGPIPTEFSWKQDDLQSNIVVRAPDDEHVFVKLKRSNDDVTLYQFFVRAGETADVDIPPATYNVCFAFGKTWYGVDELFGGNTVCSVDKSIRFTRTSGYEYTLEPVVGGNLNLEHLSLEDMLKDS